MMGSVQSEPSGDNIKHPMGAEQQEVSEDRVERGTGYGQTEDSEEDERTGALRFAVGDCVACKVGAKEWKSGRVIALWYREPQWPDERPGAPYQVELGERGSDMLIFAPADSPKVIRADGDQPLPMKSIPPSGGDTAAALHALQSELEEARRLPGIMKLEPPRVFAVAEQDGKLLEGPLDETGPFLLRAWIQGQQDSVFGATYRVHLKFNAAWPKGAPEVRFCNNISHPDIDEDGLVEDDALAPLIGKASVSGSLGPLCAVLTALRELLPTTPIDKLSDLSEYGIEGVYQQNGEQIKAISDYVTQRLAPRLFDAELGWDPTWFDPKFLEAKQRADTGDAGAWRGLLQEECWEVYSFPLFTEAFCETLIAEMAHYEASGLPVRRPNSMNEYGLILNMIGLEPMLDRLQTEVWQPIAQELFPAIGAEFDRHHSFIVHYQMGKDLGLDMHTDDSEVTFNVCLGKEFKGAGLQVCGNQASASHRKASHLYQHVKGRCLVHLGYRRHGADNITEGERLNLIVWNRNSEFRRSDRWERHHVQGKQYETEVGPPDPVCLSYTHDRDYTAFKAYTSRSAPYRKGAWCPPRFAEYEGFTLEPKSRTAEAGSAAAT